MYRHPDGTSCHRFVAQVRAILRGSPMGPCRSRPGESLKTVRLYSERRPLSRCQGSGAPSPNAQESCPTRGDLCDRRKCAQRLPQSRPNEVEAGSTRQEAATHSSRRSTRSALELWARHAHRLGRRSQLHWYTERPPRGGLRVRPEPGCKGCPRNRHRSSACATGQSSTTNLAVPSASLRSRAPPASSTAHACRSPLATSAPRVADFTLGRGIIQMRLAGPPRQKAAAIRPATQRATGGRGVACQRPTR